MAADFVPLLEMVRRRDAAGLVAALGRLAGGDPRLPELVAFALSDAPAAVGIAPRDALEAALRAGERKIDRWTLRHGVREVAFDDTPVDPFFNINTQEDLAAAELVLGQVPVVAG